MTLPRLVAPRVDDPAIADLTVDAPGDPPRFDPPVLAAIRCVFGVGAELDAVPDGDGLRPVYCVALPVDAPGSLDADDTHEFDAADMLGALQTRARGRAWAMRLELDVVQTAAAATAVDLYIAGAPDDASALHVLHSVALPGGGRRLTLGTGLVHTTPAVARLAGAYRVEQRTGDGVEAGSCGAELGMTEYEFE
jgi:hypothetical protein